MIRSPFPFHPELPLMVNVLALLLHKAGQSQKIYITEDPGIQVLQFVTELDPDWLVRSLDGL